MTGFVDSSSERYSGQVDVEVQFNTSDPEAISLVEARINAFVQSVHAGYFFPGFSRVDATVMAPGADVRAVRFEANDLPRTALDVLGALLRDCVYSGVCSFRSARAILHDGATDLLRETFRRPAAAADPLFEVDFPEEVQGDTLLIEIEFAVAVPPEEEERLLHELSLLEYLWRAYPLIEEGDEVIEPVEVFPAQRHLNDPRTIHHYESIWNADPDSWNLLVNLCCRWGRRVPIVRLHIE
jgi:hypothetical protein